MQKRDFLCKVILIYSNEMRGVEVKLQESLAPLESIRLQCNRLDGRGSAQFCNIILKTFSTRFTRKGDHTKAGNYWKDSLINVSLHPSWITIPISIITSPSHISTCQNYGVERYRLRVAAVSSTELVFHPTDSARIKSGSFIWVRTSLIRYQI